jgi:hypothetical protein
MKRKGSLMMLAGMKKVAAKPRPPPKRHPTSLHARTWAPDTTQQALAGNLVKRREISSFRQQLRSIYAAFTTANASLIKYKATHPTKMGVSIMDAQRDRMSRQQLMIDIC